MEINRAAFGALAVFGIVAAGGGAYLANRHNEAELVRAAPVYAVPAAGAAVTETENTIASVPAALEPAPQAFVPAPEPAPAPAPARVARRTPAPRPAPAPAPQRARTTPDNGGNSSPSEPPAYTRSAPVDPSVSPAIEPLENTSVDRTPVVQEPPRK